MAALAVIGTAMSMSQQRMAYKAEARAIENQASRDAETAKIRANEQTIARQERLLESLSANIASSGASGAGLGGSTYNIIKSDIESFGKEQERSDLASELQIGSIKESARNRAQAARYAGRLGIGQTLIQGATAYKALS
tara:strand:+ start:1153 stop:1569 length:417 start_codon:yes stop_codon:yes gene_type:complete